MFAKSFHNFGSCISTLDIAPKHAGVVHGIVNSAGSFAGKLIYDIWTMNYNLFLVYNFFVLYIE